MFLFHSIHQVITVLAVICTCWTAGAPTETKDEELKPEADLPVSLFISCSARVLLIGDAFNSKLVL